MLAPLPQCFLLEPSPSWAVREKRGYWLPIPNITQTMENSRKRAKTRCREGDQGPAHGLGELQRSPELPAASPCRQTLLAQTLPSATETRKRGERPPRQPLSTPAPISRAGTSRAAAGLSPPLPGWGAVLVLPLARLSAWKSPARAKRTQHSFQEGDCTHLGLPPAWPHCPLALSRSLPYLPATPPAKQQLPGDHSLAQRHRKSFSRVTQDASKQKSKAPSLQARGSTSNSLQG